MLYAGFWNLLLKFSVTLLRFFRVIGCHCSSGDRGFGVTVGMGDRDLG